MGDLFDAKVDTNDICTVLNRMSQWYHMHRFYLLTKQSQRLLTFKYPPNVWLGVTVNRKVDLHRIDDLRKTNAKVKFISFEPLMEELGEVDLTGIDWIIIGAQTRPEVQPEMDWVNDIMCTANKLKIPIFCKNNLKPLIHGVKMDYLFSTWKEFPKV